MNETDKYNALRKTLASKSTRHLVISLQQSQSMHQWAIAAYKHELAERKVLVMK